MQRRVIDRRTCRAHRQSRSGLHRHSVMQQQLAPSSRVLARPTSTFGGMGSGRLISGKMGVARIVYFDDLCLISIQNTGKPAGAVAPHRVIDNLQPGLANRSDHRSVSPGSPGKPARDRMVRSTLGNSLSKWQSIDVVSGRDECLDLLQTIRINAPPVLPRT